MNNQVIQITKTIATILERALAIAILVGLVIFSYQSILEMITWDWSMNETFYHFIYKILIAVIAVELIRTLVTHDLMAILELIAFVVARKMLNPQITSQEIFICALAFVAMLIAYKYLMPARPKHLNKPKELKAEDSTA